VASHIVLALQSIVSRNVDPVKQLVVSVTSFETDTTAYNVIPQKVHIKGTVRTLDAGVQDMAERRVIEIASATAVVFGAVAMVDYRRGYPITINSEEQTDFAASVAREISGDCKTDADLVMGAEDFSFMLNARPGAYILMGNGDSAMVHHPKYNFDDNAIPAGCSYWAGLVERRMPAA
jgi:metal-dependent amidase/aminoacylase/carboxypeptidase family protein